MNLVLSGEKKLAEELYAAVKAEKATAVCFSHLALLIKNGRIREQFLAFSEAAKATANVLLQHLKGFGEDDFTAKGLCKVCEINSESFSVVGALQFGIEVTGAGINFYKELQRGATNTEDRKLFKKFLLEQLRRKKFLEKERKFDHSREDDFITTYCTRRFMDKFWKGG